VLVGMANWLFYDDLLARLEPRTRIDLSHRLEEFRRQLSRTLTRELTPGTWLEGTVTNLGPRAVYPAPGGVEILLVADGFLELSVR